MWFGTLSAPLVLLALPVLSSGVTPMDSVHAYASDLKAPVAIRAGGTPIDVEKGHAAPAVGEIGGTRWLLVGQYGEGKLRIYPVETAKGSPRLGAFEWFRAGSDLGRVPAS
jgi:hypothetical protein